ncbi:MAG: hypothetical protein P1Q69_19195 [Candidatus Thorarchaeota archaeon]|nr:hypothetical protein [Candidatus Thorarchaeota archaeon]
MSWHESPNLHWFLVAALAAAWGISFSTQQSLEQLVLSIVGMATLLLFLAVYKSSSEIPKVLWDANRGILGVIRSRGVEANALRLIRSVPLGIDLSHSANKVLSAMSIRYQDEPGGFLEFIVHRPLGSSGTKVGFIVSRKGIRLPSGLRRLAILSDKLLEDAFVLEAAMRAAYPHTPIDSAEVEEIEIIRRGGVELLAKA